MSYGNSRRRDWGESGGVPPRWLKCPRKSDGFLGDKFLVFKTPLSADYNDYVEAQYRFYPSMVLEYVKNYKRKLGLWIDLTNTSRFYNKETIEENGETKYVKLQCRGHDGPPTKDQTSTFIKICNHYISQHPLESIGVHCTHGFNRSGYLVCAFLVESFDWSIHLAIKEFAKFRPPGIYKQEYINQLCEEYGDVGDPLPPIVSSKPDWCNEDSQVQDDDGFTTQNLKRKFDESESSSSSNFNNNGHQMDSKRRITNYSQLNKDNPTFMEGISGVEPVTDRLLANQIRKRINELCKYGGRGFIGSQPVSMDMNNINLLEKSPYMVSWKADGTRYMMFIEKKDHVYFIDRDNCIFQVNGIKFPYKKNLGEHLHDTLLDGEMVIDIHENQKLPRYLIYDIVKFRGEDTWGIDFRTRLICIRDEIVGPRDKAKLEGLIRRELEPFGIRFKTFWFLEDTANLIQGKFTQQLCHEPDGCVFQPCRDSYVFGRCEAVLKWKPPSLNTIDFKLKIATSSGEGMLTETVGELYVGGLDTPMFFIRVTKQLKQYNGKIIECKVDEKGEWKFLRERTDKSFPNAFSTAKGVLESIKNPVTKELLLDFIEKRRYRKPALQL